MRATIKNYIEAIKARREDEDREGGFSLVELIVVVVVIGILIAVAFPIFGAVQHNAAVGSLNSAAAEGATVAASEVALGNADATTIGAAIDQSETGDYTLALAPSFDDYDDLNDVCIIATADPDGALSAAGGDTGSAGPGCP
ncbi:prepilin-type N-terminal cleavage/methylation domain-containing protein [Microbacterium sp. NPDC055455]